MNHCKLIHSDIDIGRLESDVTALLAEFDLQDQPQVTLTSVTGDNDWHSANGKIHLLKRPERFYSTVNSGIQGTYIHELIQRYPDFYRWRLLKLSGRSTYSIHPDGMGTQTNLRLHIPVTTNPGCFLAFYETMPLHGHSQTVTHYQLRPGNSYQMNTTKLHTAVNYGITDRYHIVGVRYESSDNRS